MKQALDESTAAPAVSFLNEEAARAARDHGWTAPQQYDYASYNATGDDLRAAQADLPAWAHNAEKYEWKEEYGDVGPRNEALEKQLFRNELLNRAGIKFEL